MKIAIEAQRIFRKEKHGMDFVALETIRALQRLDHRNEYYILVRPGEDRCLYETGNFHVVEISCPNYMLWEQVALPMALRRISPDLVHCTANTGPLFCDFPLLLTLHDIIFLEKSSGRNRSLYQRMGRVYRKWIVPKVIPDCQLIITVSDYERGNLCKHFPSMKNKIVSVYNGLSPIFSPEKRNKLITARYSIETDYLFFLGNTDPKKNTEGMLRAYSFYLRKSKRKLPLLIADLPEHEIDRLLKKEKLGNIKPYLYYPGYIANDDLPYVYAGAFAFLYPSLRESFGLPILEAMASGVPVITSRRAAIPEIAGEGSILVDPADAEAIAARLIALEESPEYYQSAVDYGLSRSAQFSWEKTAQNLLGIYSRFGKK